MSNKLFKIVFLSVYISKVVGSTGIVCSADSPEKLTQLTAWDKQRREVFKDGQSKLFSRGSTKDSFFIVSQGMISCCEHSCTYIDLQKNLLKLTETFQKVPKNQSIPLAWDLFLLLTDKSTDRKVRAKRQMITKAKEMMVGLTIPLVDQDHFYTKMVSIINRVSANAT
jgi:hypothetical protein